jgi:hypothetical protein
VVFRKPNGGELFHVGHAGVSATPTFFAKGGVCISDNSIYYDSSYTLYVGYVGKRITFDLNYGGRFDVVNGTSYFAGVSASSYYNSSDRRLKENIRPLDKNQALQTLQKLQGVEYNWKKDPEKLKNYGCIAQDVQEVLPELVSCDPKDESLKMNYIGLIPLLLESIKELTNKVDTLQKRVEYLETQ